MLLYRLSQVEYASIPPVRACSMHLLRHNVPRFRRFLAACLVTVLLAAQAAALSPKDRDKLFEQVWQLIRDHYYDPNLHGLDWNGIHERYRDKIQNSTSDEAVYAALKQMTGELRDAHTRFKSPAERQRALRRVATTMGVMLGNVEGAPTVMDVEPGSDADVSGVQPGMILASVDGQPAAQRLGEIQRQAGTSSSERAAALLGYFRLLDGPPGSLVRAQFLKANKTTLDVVLKRHVVSTAPHLTTRMLPQGFVYIRVPPIRACVF